MAESVDERVAIIQAIVKLDEREYEIRKEMKETYKQILSLQSQYSALYEELQGLARSKDALLERYYSLLDEEVEFSSEAEERSYV